MPLLPALDDFVTPVAVRRRFVGIDPGKKGFTAELLDDALHTATPIPVTKDNKYDLPAIVALARTWRGHWVVLERQQAAYKRGGHNEQQTNNMVRSSFTTGRGFGMWEGVLTALGIKYILVMPGVWKRKMGITVPKDFGSQDARKKESKRLAKAKAAELFPGIDLRAKPSKRCKPNADKAEAILLAYYGIHHGKW